MEWLVRSQNQATGCFNIKGFIHNKRLAGSFADQRQLALNAFITSVIIETTNCENIELINNAMNCIQQVLEFQILVY